MKLLALITVFLASLAQASAKIDADLKTYDETVASKEKEFAQISADPKNIGWVKLKISHMFEIDQYMRKFYMNTPFEHNYTEEEKTEFNKIFMLRFIAVDKKDTADLKDLLKIYRWFTISKFGKQADNEAWCMVQHADLDKNFQKHVLTILEKLPKGETSKTNIAYLNDRIDAANKVPQKYGTQGKCKSPGVWEPDPIAEPVSELDQRRASMDLGLEAEYIAGFKTICH